MSITLPEWSLWLIGTLIVLAIASRFKSSGQWDFVTPLFGCAIVLGWALFVFGVLLGRACK